MKSQTKLSFWLFGLSVVAVIVHNILYGIFGAEDVLFFILTLAFGSGFVISVVYNMATHIKKGEPKDLWMLGYLGLFGLLGVLPRFGSGFYGFFGFFGFFGLKKR